MWASTTTPSSTLAVNPGNITFVSQISLIKESWHRSLIFWCHKRSLLELSWNWSFCSLSDPHANKNLKKSLKCVWVDSEISFPLGQLSKARLSGSLHHVPSELMFPFSLSCQMHGNIFGLYCSISQYQQLRFSLAQQQQTSWYRFLSLQ